MTTAAAASAVEQLRAAVRAFEAAQAEYRQYGAQDTEPDGVFQGLMRRATAGKPVRVPVDGSAWELYSSSMDCSRAAAALSQAAQAVIDIIQNCPLGQSDELQKYVKSYCWRYE